MADQIQADIIDLQDIEKMQFLTAMQSDPAKYTAYINEKSGRILNETIDAKRASFVKVTSDMGRMMDMDHNSLAALKRTQELIEAEQAIIEEQKKQTNARTYNKDLTRRQVEINNWYYENKRETLFILQLILLVVLTVVIVLYLSHSGWITQDAADYMMWFVVIVGSGTWLYRWYYTTYIRDARYWSSRKFQSNSETQGSGCPPSTYVPPAPVPTCPSGGTLDRASGMCVSLKSTTTSLPSICPSGTTYSKTTGRCEKPSEPACKS